MTEREKLDKKKLLLNYAERIGMEVLADYGSYLAVGFPVEKHDIVVSPAGVYPSMLGAYDRKGISNAAQQNTHD